MSTGNHESGWHEDLLDRWFEHFVDGNIHNEDGYAAYYNDGSDNFPKEWWYEDKIIGRSCEGYTQEKFEIWLKFKVFL